MLARGATLTAANTEQPRDTRLQPTGAFGTAAPGIAGQIVSGQSDTIVVSPFAVGEMLYAHKDVATQATAHQAQMVQPFVLAPNDALLVAPSDSSGGFTANTAIQATVFWRERTLEPTET